MTAVLQNIRSRPEVLLLLMAGAVPLSFATWQALLNNFAIERAAFSGAEWVHVDIIRRQSGAAPGVLEHVLDQMLDLCIIKRDEKDPNFVAFRVSPL